MIMKKLYLLRDIPKRDGERDKERDRKREREREHEKLKYRTTQHLVTGPKNGPFIFK
jgi:hypothetical protein